MPDDAIVFQPTWLHFAIPSLLCALVVGFAGQRGSICAVRAVDNLVNGKSPRLFLSFLQCALWVALISWPLFWFVPGAKLPESHPLDFAIIAGSLAFGIGAALNGACGFSTLIRLSAGEISFGATILGMAMGLLVYDGSISPIMRLPALPSLAATASIKSFALLSVFALLAFWLVRKTSKRDGGSPARNWSPERAALWFGLGGGVLYALNGSWTYTTVLRSSLSDPDWASAPNFWRMVLVLAVLLGAGVAARQSGQWRLRFKAREAILRLGAGILMGIGAGAIPGGNDALILHGLPALSPHAVPAYIALTLGTAAVILISRRVQEAALKL